MNKYCNRPGKHTQRGMTLVEIMVAMVLSLILLGGVVQIMASTRMSYRVHEAVTQMQENGRFAMETLSRDIRMADFWGCANNISMVTNNLDSTGTGYVDFSNGGIAGAEGAGSNPDTLILRGGFNAGFAPLAPFGPQTSSDITVAAGNGLSQGDVVFISDCTSADIFQITNADPGTTGTLEHKTGGTSPGNVNVSDPGCPGANGHCLSKIYGADATVFRVQQISYSIAAGADGQPALFRNGQELVDGIENLQVLYGEDTDGSGTANRYVDAGQVSDMNDVVSIRLALVTRSYADNLTTSAQSYNLFGTSITAPDSRLRQVYTATVSVRNRLR